MSMNVYRSKDRGAPVLTGGVGGMMAVLDGVMTTGYPTGSVTSITRSGSVATVSHTGHNFLNNQEVSISGATQTEYNGKFRITYIDANSYSYTVSGTPTTPATGTILAGGEKTVGTVTLTRSGTTVTATCTGHGFSANQRVRIMGATQHQYNGLWAIASVPNANTFTYELWPGYAPATPATGTIICRYGVCATGWEFAYTGTNKRAWRQGVKGSLLRAYMRADQSSASYHQKVIQTVMVEGMTGIDSYTNSAFPGMSPGYVGQWVVGTTDSTPHDWVIAGDERTVIFLNRPAESANGYADVDWSIMYQGDFIDYVYGSLYPQVSCPGLNMQGYGSDISAGQLYNLSSNIYGCIAFQQSPTISNGYGTEYRGWHLLRNHAGAVGAMTATLRDPVGQSLCPEGNYTGSRGGFGYYPNSSHDLSNTVDTYPDTAHGGINMSRPVLITGGTSPNTGADRVRGEIKGLWTPQHRRISGWQTGDMFRGSGQLSGKVFEVFLLNGFTDDYWLLLEISDTWDS